MRRNFLVPALATALALGPLAALAQPATAPAAPTATPQTNITANTPMTREQFVARAADRAGRMFDEIDVNHTGSITRAQVREWIHAHRHQRMQPPQ